MSKLFVDTNVFLRFLTRDHPEQSRRSRTFLESAIDNSDTVLLTSDAVIMEMIFTLRSHYQVARTESAALVNTLLGFCEMVSPNEDFDWRQVFQVEQHRKIDFIDALNYRIMLQEGIPTVVSFDTDFDGLEAVARQAL